MLKFIQLLLLILVATTAFGFELKDGPLVIGDRVKPDASAIFQVESTLKGILPPRMTQAERDLIAAPATGLQIYNTTANFAQVYDGASWISLGVAGGGFTPGSVIFAGATGAIDEDSTNFFWDDTNDILKLGVGTVDTSSIFEAFSTTKGTRPCPTMTEVQRDAIAAPAGGLCVYNSITDKLNIYNSTLVIWESAGGGGLDKWITGAAYIIDDVIWEPLSDKIYRCNTGHTSGVFATDIANWTELSVPTFEDVIFDPANEINGPVTHMGTLQKTYSHISSAGIMDGCAITDNADGTVSIALGVVSLRETADTHGNLVNVNIAASGVLTLTDDTTNYLYIDYNTGSPQWVVTTSATATNGLDKVLGYFLTRESNTLNIIDARDKSVDFANKADALFHDFGKFIHAEGGTSIGSSGLNVTVTAGRFYFGVNPIDHVAFDTSIAGTANANVFEYYYGGWVEVVDSKAIDNVNYDNAGTLTALGSGKWKVDWIYMLNNSPSSLAIIYGDTQYNNQAAADLATRPSSVPPSIEGVGSLIGRYLVKEGVGTLVAQSFFVVPFAASGVTEHNDLSGLQGGTTAEYYHLDATEFGFLDGQDQSVLTTSTPTFGGLNLNGDLVFTSAASDIHSNTLDGSDTYDFTVTAGGDGSVSRGSVLRYAGNESVFTGDLLIALGDNAAAEFQVSYGVGVTIGGLMDSNGKWTLGTTAGTQTHQINGSLDATDFITVDNLKLDGNTLSVTNTNGDLLLHALGTGAIQLSQNPLEFTQLAGTPSTPSAGFSKIYFKADNKIYFLDNSGVEHEITGNTGTAADDTLARANVGIDTSVAASALTVKLVQKDGSSDPTGANTVDIAFRNTTITTGGYTVRSATAATSIIVPSGATLGTENGVGADIYIYAIDNAGAIELAVSRSFFSDEAVFISTVALSAASDSATVLYSTNARTSVPFRYIGKIESNQTTAGTWAASPSIEYVGQRPVQRVAYLKDVKSSGTAGGTFTLGAWRTRTLNTVEGDSEIVSISSNQFTLSAGKYRIEASAPAYNVNNHQAKLRDITNSLDIIIGTGEWTWSAGQGTARSVITGQIVLTVPTTFEIQHYSGTTKTTDGFGRAVGHGVDEIYTQVKITKIK